MTSEPAPEKPAAPLPLSSACLVLLQRPSRIASRRPACAVAVLLITVLVPLVTGAAPLPPPRPRNQGSAPSPPPATLLQGSHGWHPGPDRGSRAALRLTRDARLALQAEPGPTPPHPGAEA